MEPLRMLGHPNLFADGQIFRIAPQRRLPFGNRLVPRTTAEQLCSKAQLRFHQHPLRLAQLIRSRAALSLNLFNFPGDQALDGIHVGCMLDTETAKLLIPDDAMFIQNDAVRDEFIAVQLRQAVFAINHGWEGCPGCLDPGTRRLGALGVDRDRDQLKLLALVAVVLDETLPPGQLVAAVSPAGPEEEQRLFPAERVQRQLATIKQR